MRLGFSEFSYGYAFTENLFRWSGNFPDTAPKFPNLVEEGQLGYDVKIEIDQPGQPLFFQFKMPELMKRSTAREIAHLGLSDLSVPFFRMPLMRRNVSNQHELLIDLEGKYPDRVFYASTLSEDEEAFHSAYGNATVHLHSAFFSPSGIGPLPDNEKHSVAYAYEDEPSIMFAVNCISEGAPAGGPGNLLNAWLCSEPEPVKALNFWNLRQIERTLPDADQRPLRETAREIIADVIQRLPEEIKGAEREMREAIHRRVTARLEGEDKPDGDVELDKDRVEIITEILVTRELARVGLGVEMMIAQPRKPE